MDENLEWFWSIIDKYKGDPEALESEMKNGFSKEQLIKFDLLFKELASLLFRDRSAQYVDDETSKDDIEGDAYWIVSQGRELYEKIIEDGSKYEDILHEVDAEDTLHGIADSVYVKRFDEVMPDNSDKFIKLACISIWLLSFTTGIWAFINVFNAQFDTFENGVESAFWIGYLVLTFLVTILLGAALVKVRGLRWHKTEGRLEILRAIEREGG